MSKYVKSGESPVAFECTKRKCKWQGTEAQKGHKRVSSYMTEHVCPECGNPEFYGLREIPKEA